MKIILATLFALANTYSVNNQEAILANFASSSRQTRSNRISSSRHYHSDDEDDDEHEHVHVPEPPSLFDSDDEDHHVHIAPKPPITYGTSTHNNSHKAGFSATQDINEYTGDFDAKVDEFDSCDDICN